MSIKGKSLAVLTPMYGGVCMNNYHDSIITLKEGLLRFGIPHSFLSVYNESLITRARNRLVDSYLKQHEHTHSVMIDADIGFDPRDLLAMLEMDKDIIGAPCSKKVIRWDKVQAAVARAAKPLSNEAMAQLGSECVFNFVPFEGQREINLGEPQEVESCGTGLLMVKRTVYEKMMEVFPERWYEPRGDSAAIGGPVHNFFRADVNPDTHDYDSEDYWFCKEARKVGFKVWVWPCARTSHMGTYTFHANLMANAALVGGI